MVDFEEFSNNFYIVVKIYIIVNINIILYLQKCRYDSWILKFHSFTNIYCIIILFDDFIYNYLLIFIIIL